MRGHIEHIDFLGRKLFIYTPPSYGRKSDTSPDQNRIFPVLYSHDGQEVSKLSEAILTKIEEGFTDERLQEFIWVGIYPEKRQDEYTPWPAPALDSRFEAFGGQGKAYIDFVVNKVKVYIDENYDTKSEAEHTWVMGYSLGGLISLYSAYETPIFGKIGSICGSFWYEGMVDWVKQHKVLNPSLEVFMYYGKTEGKGKTNIQQYAAARAEEIIEHLGHGASGVKSVKADCDEGGHHQYLTKRYEKMIAYMVSNK